MGIKSSRWVDEMISGVIGTQLRFRCSVYRLFADVMIIIVYVVCMQRYVSYCPIRPRLRFCNNNSLNTLHMSIFKISFHDDQNLFSKVQVATKDFTVLRTGSRVHKLRFFDTRSI
jgi:hypothetical protein